MELNLEIENPENISMEGHVEIELPNYFTTLDESELEYAKSCFDVANLIIACGISNTGEIEFVTGDMKMRKIQSSVLPCCKIQPWAHGRHVLYKQTDINYESSIPSRILIMISQPLI